MEFLAKLLPEIKNCIKRFKQISVQQIWEQDRHNTIIGGRFEYGHLENASIQGVPSHDPGFFPAQFKPAAVQDIRSLFERVSLYGYHQWQIVDALQLTGG